MIGIRMAFQYPKESLWLIVRVMQSLTIDLGTLPEEGKRFSGELEAAIFDLSEKDPQPKSSFFYNLFVQRFEGELLLQGELSCQFEFECVRTLEPFLKTLSLRDAAIAVEIGAFGEVNVTEALREELLLEIPSHPNGEMADNPKECEIDPRYLALDKEDENGVNTAPPETKDSRWSALDGFVSGED